MAKKKTKSKKKKAKKKVTKKVVDSVTAWHELEPTDAEWQEAYNEHIMSCCDPEYF